MPMDRESLHQDLDGEAFDSKFYHSPERTVQISNPVAFPTLGIV